jgi:pimeloyl-ACP methyl ester carboxylesterase
MLSKVHDELAKRDRVVAFEMPGFAQSPVNTMGQSVKDLAQTMLQATAQLGLETYALIGTSFGGMMARWQAIQAPQQVGPLVFIGSTAVLPEGYLLPSVATDQIGKLLFAHTENVPAQLSVDVATLTQEVALLRGRQRSAVPSSTSLICVRRLLSALGMAAFIPRGFHLPTLPSPPVAPSPTKNP